MYWCYFIPIAKLIRQIHVSLQVNTELMEVKRKYARDTAVGNDVTAALEKEREKLQLQVRVEQTRSRKFETEYKNLLQAVNKERQRFQIVRFLKFYDLNYTALTLFNRLLIKRLLGLFFRSEFLVKCSNLDIIFLVISWSFSSFQARFSVLNAKSC